MCEGGKLLNIADQDITTASKGIKRMYAPDIIFFDPPDVLDPLRAVCDSPDEVDSLRVVCDCCTETTVTLLVVVLDLEVNGMVVIPLTTNPDRARLMVSPSTT
jgi:hypothetical protein